VPGRSQGRLIRLESMFALNGVRHAYAGVDTLRLERFAAAQGEHWLVLGPSGCGKSTLLHLIAGLLRPLEGEIEVAGERLERMSEAALDRWRGRSIGIVPQRLHLLPSLRLQHNLLLAQYAARLPQKIERVREVLARVGLAERADAYPHELSHGEAQRAAVARAVINRPAIVLADEPTSNLDDANCAQALDLLEGEAHACGATLVIATHDRRARDRFGLQLTLGA
jgi:ABC-type lipoprotein export system ATPase subunit